MGLDDPSQKQQTKTGLLGGGMKGAADPSVILKEDSLWIDPWSLSLTRMGKTRQTLVRYDMPWTQGSYSMGD